MKQLLWPLLALTSVVGFLLGLVAAGSGGTRVPQVARLPASTFTEPLALPQPLPPPDAPSSGPADFATVVSRLSGTVVNVDTVSRDSEEGSRFVFPRRWSDELREGSGSGFVIDPSGLILTNYHVIDDASRVTVTMRDGRLFHAKVVGIDPAIDVALLQVSPPEPLRAAPLGRSKNLRVGEWVCAIGNPLGYVHSVTVGVVSFLGRKVFDPSLDALIQTDAAITFGNSGGPLINVRGEVIGITAAISGQAANIGFAVPIDQVVAVLQQMKDTGSVTRGYLGLGLTTITPELQRALRVQPAQGALVQEVPEGTPAERAGLRTYDVVVAADDQSVSSDEELTRFIASRRPGTVATLRVWRDGQTVAVPVKLTQRPLPPSMRSLTADKEKVRPASGDQLLGLSVGELDAAQIHRRNLPETLGGVVVTSVDAAGPARVTPIKTGQILLEINRQRVLTVAQYRAVVSALRGGMPVAVLMYDPASRQRFLHAFVTDPAP
jgi:serine protease Do